MRSDFEFDPKSVPKAVLQEAMQRNQLQKELLRRRLPKGQDLVVQYGPEKDDRAESFLEEPRLYRILWSGPEGQSWPTEISDHVRCRFNGNGRQAMVWTFTVAQAAGAEKLLRDLFEIEFSIPRYGC
jgi:hypothetical protein